jgi:hypothetical protein
MPLNSEEKKVTEEGKDKNALMITFTNGALAQLEELKSFLKVNDKIDVIKFGMSMIQNLKEQEEKKK